ncbi:Phosphoglycolate phosphatase, HAD superfamily [Marininema mesophilum]|uniref:Phosphoglycolate phosphatase, HAD superfamily n=1 Tax=Marininema mesophilum TaxID=1048340 RepID=A0A1H2X8G9_9BACL|nr:HAD hydrolase-like protein [Marininema mesophilum]SDW88559.1 Phosphoglycolate phosphatase, HAD superfamily [Marininema mesophilum]
MVTKHDSGILFDMDGTLFQTEKVAVPAFHRTFQRLVDRGLYKGKSPTDDQVCSVFGMTSADIWERLLPGASVEVKEQADGWWLEDELDCLSEGLGALYPGVKETLIELKERGWKLVIASNGLAPYLHGILAKFELDRVFDGVYSAAEEKVAKKSELIRILLQEMGIRRGFMIGDRSSDVEGGKGNELPVIGCRYTGFPTFADEGELRGADHVIDHFSQIKGLVGNPK